MMNHPLTQTNLEDLILTKHIDFNRYEQFVSAVTSECSTNFVDFADRIGELDREGANIERLLTLSLIHI